MNEVKASVLLCLLTSMKTQARMAYLNMAQPFIESVAVSCRHDMLRCIQDACSNQTSADGKFVFAQQAVLWPWMLNSSSDHGEPGGRPRHSCNG